jgi:DNA-binding NarL/FixJ family response regulator
MIRAGVPAALRERSAAISPSIEDLENLMAAGVEAAGGNSRLNIEPIIERAVAAGREAGKAERAGKDGKVPKTRRGLAKLSQTSVKDMPIIAAIKEGQSYRAVADQLNVSKSTVARIAVHYGLTGHAPDGVPLDGTLEENLTIREKSRKSGKK